MSPAPANLSRGSKRLWIQGLDVQGPGGRVGEMAGSGYLGIMSPGKGLPGTDIAQKDSPIVTY